MEALTEKPCSKCGVVKPLEQFYRRSVESRIGRTSACKGCLGIGQKALRAGQVEQIAAKRREQRARYAELGRKYNQTRKDKRREEKRRERAMSPEKHRARAAVKYALSVGKLVRQGCEVCGAEKAHAHHDDYSQKLAVRWLCPVHHAEAHMHKELRHVG